MSDEVRVWIEHNLCTGDGLCVQYAPDVFEFDDAGVAHVKSEPEGPLLTEVGASANVPPAFASTSSTLPTDARETASTSPGSLTVSRLPARTPSQVAHVHTHD
ncbi:hypothetical protein GCM10020255_012840 [Rhodococcus baikonurensis]